MAPSAEVSRAPARGRASHAHPGGAPCPPAHSTCQLPRALARPASPRRLTATYDGFPLPARAAPDEATTAAAVGVAAGPAQLAGGQPSCRQTLRGSLVLFFPSSLAGWWSGVATSSPRIPAALPVAAAFRAPVSGGPGDTPRTSLVGVSQPGPKRHGGAPTASAAGGATKWFPCGDTAALRAPGLTTRLTLREGAHCAPGPRAFGCALLAALPCATVAGRGPLHQSC